MGPTLPQFRSPSQKCLQTTCTSGPTFEPAPQWLLPLALSRPQRRKTPRPTNHPDETAQSRYQRARRTKLRSAKPRGRNPSSRRSKPIGLQPHLYPIPCPTRCPDLGALRPLVVATPARRHRLHDEYGRAEYGGLPVNLSVIALGDNSTVAASAETAAPYLRSRRCRRSARLDGCSS